MRKMNIQQLKTLVLQRIFMPFSGRQQTSFNVISLPNGETGFQFITFHHAGPRGNTVLSAQYTAEGERNQLNKDAELTSGKFMEKMSSLGLESSLTKSEYKFKIRRRGITIEDSPTIHKDDKIIEAMRVDIYSFSLEPKDVEAKIDEICKAYVPSQHQKLFTELMNRSDKSKTR